VKRFYWLPRKGSLPVTVALLCRWRHNPDSDEHTKHNVAIEYPDGRRESRPFRGLRAFDGPTCRAEYDQVAQTLDMFSNDKVDIFAEEPVDVERAVGILTWALGVNFTAEIKSDA